MPYVYDKVDDLEGTEKVGSKQCLALLQHCASVPRTTSFLRKKGKGTASAYDGPPEQGAALKPASEKKGARW